MANPRYIIYKQVFVRAPADMPKDDFAKMQEAVEQEVEEAVEQMNNHLRILGLEVQVKNS
jgi:hypothetical protein